MNKLEKMRTLLQQSKKLDLLQTLHKKQLYKSQPKQRKIQCLIDYSKQQLHYSLVYMSPYNNQSDQQFGSRKEKRNKSTSEKKDDHFFTPLITLREKTHICFENVKNASQMMTKSISKSVRFNQVEWNKVDNAIIASSIAKCEDNHQKKISENVFVLKPKKQKKMTEVRIRKNRKTQNINKVTQSSQFTLCGWQTLNQQEPL